MRGKFTVTVHPVPKKRPRTESVTPVARTNNAPPHATLVQVPVGPTTCIRCNDEYDTGDIRRCSTCAVPAPLCIICETWHQCSRRTANLCRSCTSDSALCRVCKSVRADTPAPHTRDTPTLPQPTIVPTTPPSTGGDVKRRRLREKTTVREPTHTGA